MIEMNIHKALSTKKLLEKKINKAITDLDPIGCKLMKYRKYY